MDKISQQLKKFERDTVSVIENAHLHPAVVELVLKNVLNSVSIAVQNAEDSEEENDPNAENNPKS